MSRSWDEKHCRPANLERLRRDVEAEQKTAIPPEAWTFLVEYQGLADELLPPGDDDIRAVIEQFIQYGLAPWTRCVEKAARIERGPRGKRRGPTTTRSAGPHVYGKILAEHLRLLRFVAERAKPVANRGVPGFDTSGHSILWEQVHAEWMKGNPSYRGAADALARAYRRAKNDRRACELYFDDEFRDWAAQAEALRATLSWLEDAGLRPEDVFVKSIAGQSTRLLEDARRLLERAQALRRANEAEDIDSATRKRNEESAKGLEASAQALTRASQFTKWSRISMQLSPDAGRVLARAITRNCRLTESFAAYPRGTVFCERPRCDRCKVGADLLREKLIAAPGGLRPSSAKGAGERHSQRLDESARVMQRLPNPSPDSRRSGQPTDSGRSPVSRVADGRTGLTRRPPRTPKAAR